MQSGGMPYCDLDVISADGRKMPMTEYGRSYLNGADGSSCWEESAERAVSIPLDKCFKLEAGHFTVELHIAVTFKSTSEPIDKKIPLDVLD